MGQDIHIKTFIWSKVENKYIDGMSLSDSPQYSAFRPFFDGRYYDFFSLFGSMRSDFKPLAGAHEEIPKFLPKTYLEFLKKMGGDYHTFSWYDIVTLKKEMEIYIEELKDPLKYYADIDEDMVETIKAGDFDQALWKESTESLISTLKGCIKNLDLIYSDEDWIGEFIDINKTIFVICFDN